MANLTSVKRGGKELSSKQKKSGKGDPGAGVFSGGGS